ncbi:MAG: OmpA family protein, partial [Hyphomicrobiaceae bacterium]
ATVRIDLGSINSGVDVRDVRMRFMLFETFKFPHATIKAKLDRSKLQAVLAETRIAYPLSVTVDLHGTTNTFDTKVWVTRLDASTVSVSSIEPIIVKAEQVGLAANIARLVEVIGGKLIASGASITFDLVFGTGNQAPALVSARSEREARRAEEAARPITEEACATRFGVITEARAIYFKTASAELDADSEPLLKSVIDVASRCPSVRFDVEGHTDNVGAKSYNRTLSEQRAKAVVDYLTGRGIDATRVRFSGFGDSRPVAPNDNEPGRARNRRIEFKVVK